jgi:CheY-like chemotaxis protein
MKMKKLNRNKIIELEGDLNKLGLLEKTREIYSELGYQAAASYIKSSYHLLSKVYHPDLNPEKLDKANDVQLILNKVNQLLDQIEKDDFEELLKKDLKEPVKRKQKILVVEDEFGLQEVFRDIFLMEGFDVRLAVDGDDGYKVYQEFNPDLVFTDVVMPKMTGIELVEKIRELDSKIKVIYTSGFFGINRVKRDLAEEILRYGYRTLPKPFKVSVMLEMVHQYLED